MKLPTVHLHEKRLIERLTFGNDLWAVLVKKRSQRDGRRGAVMIKSNPIPTEWVTHGLKNNETKEVLLLL